MATTLRLWKEIITKKYKESGFNYFGYFDKKYEVVFKKKLSDDLVTMWFNAYVKLEEPLQESYIFEGYRYENIIGCDTADHTSKSEIDQSVILRNRIIAIINEHNDL